MRYRPILAVVAGCTLLTACEGLKEALTAHVDVVARAAGQELSVTRLADLLGNAKVPVPVTKENAQIVADLWRNYQLLGYAAAHGDSLNDKKSIDAAVGPLMANMRLRKLMDTISKSFKVDTGSEAEYNQGAHDLFAARHILFAYPTPATQTQKDSVKKVAQGVLPQVNAKNFAAMATKYSNDPGSKTRGGDLGVFQKTQMVPQFGNAVAALKPGQISGLVESPYGFHIIQREPYAEAKAQFSNMFGGNARQAAESTYLTNLEKSSNIEVKSSAPATAKAAAADMPSHRKDNAVLATFKGGDLTAAQFVGWLQTFPPQSRITQQLQQAPDSLVKTFIKSVARNEVMLKQADSLHIQPSPEEQAQIYTDFSQLVNNVWQSLGVDPKALSDSAKTASERERVAAARVESFLDRVLSGQAQPVGVPTPLQTLIQDKYESSVNPAGVDRAVERAVKVRASADSARQANMPKSQVPLPGAQPPGVRPQAPQPPPNAAQPPATKKP